MKSLNLSLMIILITIIIFGWAKFWGWGKEWNYLTKEGSCLVQYSIQHYYIFGIDIGREREIEVERTCVE